MSLIRCRYCEHDNPVDSKFCGSCGGALTLPSYLASCPRCGTVNPVTATVCCWCNSQLSARKSSPHGRSRAIVATAALAVVAVLGGYYTYRQSSHAEAPLPSAASSDPSGRGVPAGAGLLDGDAADGATKSVSADGGAGLASPATSPFGAPTAEPVRAAASQARAGRQPVKPQEAKASQPGPFRAEVCAEAAAALGLCVTKSVQKKEPAAIEAAIKRPQATDAGAQEPPHPQTCTDGVAALGLCTPRPTQRRE